MIGFVIAGHGAFSEGILKSVEMIAGKLPQVRPVSFFEDTLTFTEELEKAISEVDDGSGIVCFTDLAGGTPFNICSQIALKRKNMRIIGGVNSPMLLSSVFMRNVDLDSFVNKVMEEGRNNIKLFQLKERNKENEDQGI